MSGTRLAASSASRRRIAESEVTQIRAPPRLRFRIILKRQQRRLLCKRASATAHLMQETKMTNVVIDLPHVAMPAAKPVAIPGKGARASRLLAVIAVGAIIWFAPVPQGIALNAWHLFAIFVATILGLILQPLPMGAMVLIAVITTAL